MTPPTRTPPPRALALPATATPATATPATALPAAAPRAAPRAWGAVPPILGLAPPQVAGAAEVLSRAFHDDPVMLHIAPDPARRLGAVAAGFRTLVRFALRGGAVDTTPGTDGAAIWVAPGRFPVPVSALLGLGFLGWPRAFGLGGFGRALRVMAHMDEVHLRAIRGPHWYFWVLGVDPPRHGGGLGSRLIEHGLARADAQGLAVYCETFRPRMVPYLQRFGFRVVAETTAPGGGPRMWSLLRPARPGSA